MATAALQSGVALGPYEIEGLIGAGGMGEVYRARDTRLNRVVAIKLLPAVVATNPARRDRLDREARVISRLNHPHVRALYDIGAHKGSAFLVMEYLEGETLENRLAKRPMSMAAALTYAAQIADALSAAHREGIVHGDVKPANVMLTAGGAKLLDFGVARLLSDPTETGDDGRGATTLSEGDRVPGTTAYMAPEQLEGADPDPRSDVFALGVVLYEMLAGRRPFEADSRARLIVEILEHEPTPLASSTERLPPALVRATMKALTKDPDARWQDARDFSSELQWIAQGAGPAASGRMPRRGSWLWAAGGATTAAVFALAFSTIPWNRRAAAVAEPGVVRFLADAPTGSSITVAPGAFAVAPDGRRLAFIASAGNGTRRLWLRSFDSFDTQSLNDTDDAWNPFWSPDGHAIGFMAGGQIRLIDLRTNTVQTVADHRATGFAAWSSTGVILVASNGTLLRVNASGGRLTAVPPPEALRGALITGVDFLPDGRHFVYHVRATTPELSGIYIASLDDPDSHRRLAAGDSQAQYSTAGYLLYIRSGALVAHPFDITTLATTGEPRILSEPVSFVQGVDRGAFSLSGDNVLAYRARITGSELLWFDRSGRPLGSLMAPGPFLNPALAPDGVRIALARYDIASATSDIWIVDANRAVRQLTATSAVNDFPVWSPDGRRVLFVSRTDTAARLLVKDVNAGVTEAADTLVDTPATKIPWDWTQDGRFVLYSTFAGLGSLGARFWVAPTQAPFELEIGATVKEEGQGQISPDGRWLAYVYDVNGSPQVFVRPFPRGSARWLVGSGFEPKWRGDSQELFYLAPDQTLMAVPVANGAGFQPGDPRPLFRTSLVGAYLGVPYPRSRVRNEYAVTRDGQRFLINQPVGGSDAYGVRVLVNWRGLLAP